jgi:hypothetical protein
LRGVEQRVAQLVADTADQTPRERLLAVFDTPAAAALATSLDDPAPWAHAHKAAEALIDQAVGS